MKFSVSGQIMTNCNMSDSTCFRLFLEIPVLEKLMLERSLERTAKVESNEGTSEAPGCSAWDVLSTCRLALPVPKLGAQRTGAAVGILMQVWCVLPVLYMFMFNTLVYMTHWIYHCQIWVMLYESKETWKTGRGSWVKFQREISVIC